MCGCGGGVVGFYLYGLLQPERFHGRKRELWWLGLGSAG